MHFAYIMMQGMLKLTSVSSCELKRLLQLNCRVNYRTRANPSRGMLGITTIFVSEQVVVKTIWSFFFYFVTL